MDASFEPASQAMHYSESGIQDMRQGPLTCATRHVNFGYCRMSIHLHFKEDEVEDLAKMVVAI